MMKFRVRFGGALVAFIALASVWPASACADTFDDALVRARAKGDAAAVTQILQTLTKAHAAKPTLENGNALGAALVLTGKLDDAINLLEETDRNFPGSALVAANLGTAFELAGKTEKALDWIREGIKRDASEHDGSEWLHARILVAKIAFAKDPKWFEKNRVLELEFGTEDVPMAPEILPVENGKVKGAEQLVHQIEYQLREQTIFRGPPDPVLGDLYASMGDLKIAGALSPLDRGSFDPVDDYEQALRYGAPRSDLIKKRLAKYRADLAVLPPAPKEPVADYPVASKRFNPPSAGSGSLWIYVGAATALMVVLVIIGMLLDRRRRKRADATPAVPLPDVE